jgi:hydroxymethylglutaryl-CoA reductase
MLDPLFPNIGIQTRNFKKLHDEFIENTITNFYLPLGVAPNFLINNTLYTVPMAIEESSVVAAASKSAKFWLERGGFKTRVLATEKIGQVHFLYPGDFKKLQSYFQWVKPRLFADCAPDHQKYASSWWWYY